MRTIDTAISTTPATTPTPAIGWDELDRLGRVLAIFAHPDDETYLVGGLAAGLAARGLPLTLVTATYGENGPDATRHERDEGDPSPAHERRDLGAVRRAELAEALATLGVRDHTFIGLPDGGCADVPEQTAITALATLLRLTRPDTVITFPPDGLTGHPDHMAVSRWTATAVRHVFGPAAATSPRLLHAMATAEFQRDFADVDQRLGISFGAPPPRPAVATVPVRLVLPEPIVDRKLAALRAQWSQTAPLFGALTDARLRAWVGEEVFVDA